MLLLESSPAYPIPLVVFSWSFLQIDLSLFLSPRGSIRQGSSVWPLQCILYIWKAGYNRKRREKKMSLSLQTRSDTVAPNFDRPMPELWTTTSPSPSHQPSSSITTTATTDSCSPTRELADANSNNPSYDEFVSQQLQTFKEPTIIPALQPFPPFTSPSPPPAAAIPKGPPRRYYSSPLSDDCQFTPVEMYGLEQPEQMPSIHEQRVNKRRSRFSTALALDDIKEDMPLQLDQQHKRFSTNVRRLSSASIMRLPPPSRSATTTSILNSNHNSARDGTCKSNSAVPSSGQHLLKPSLARRLSVLSIGSIGSKKGFQPTHSSASISQPNLVASTGYF